MIDRRPSPEEIERRFRQYQQAVDPYIQMLVRHKAARQIIYQISFPKGSEDKLEDWEFTYHWLTEQDKVFAEILEEIIKDIQRICLGKEPDWKSVDIKTDGNHS
jgi:hypothetical protein